MNIMKRVWAWVLGLFMKPKEVVLPAPVTYSDVKLEPVQVKPFKWKKHKHPLHRYHCGTFSPIKPWARVVR